MKTTDITGKKILEIFDEIKDEFKESLQSIRNIYERVGEVRFPFASMERAYVPSAEEGIAALAVRYKNRNEWDEKKGFVLPLIVNENLDFGTGTDEVRIITSENVRVYTVLTLPDGKRQATIFRPVFFRDFTDIVEEKPDDNPSGGMESAEYYFGNACFPQGLCICEDRIYIPSPYGIACGRLLKWCDIALFDRFVPKNAIEGGLDGEKETCRELEKRCEQLWNEWFYEKPAGTLKLLAQEFRRIADYVEESVAYRVEDHELYDPEGGENFDKMIGIGQVRERFRERLEVLDDFVQFLLTDDSNLFCHIEGLKRMPYSSAPDLERTDYAALHGELLEWMDYAEKLCKLDRYVDNPYNIPKGLDGLIAECENAIAESEKRKEMAKGAGPISRERERFLAEQGFIELGKFN